MITMTCIKNQLLLHAKWISMLRTRLDSSLITLNKRQIYNNKRLSDPKPNGLILEKSERPVK